MTTVAAPPVGAQPDGSGLDGRPLAEPPIEPPPFDLEGAGVLSGWADLATALTAEQVDPYQVGFAAAGAGLDTLGAVLHPFDALLQAGLGWLVEHVAFLREPLDALAGDPDAVLGQARHWDQVAGELRAAAVGYRAADVPGWDGAAAAGYRRSADGLAQALSAGAEQADLLSRLILATGAAVGTVRALIRDAVADFVASVVQYLLAASTLAFLTAGGSLGGLVVAVVVRALEVAQHIARRVQQLVDALIAAGGAAARIGSALRRAGARIREAEPALRASAEALHRAAESSPTPLVIESGKQLTDATQRREAWRKAQP